MSGDYNVELIAGFDVAWMGGRNVEPFSALSGRRRVYEDGTETHEKKRRDA